MSNMTTERATCPTCGATVAVEWRQFPFHEDWAYFLTMHSRPDNGWPCQGIGEPVTGVVVGTEQ